jgi:hypothetical protein
MATPPQARPAGSDAPGRALLIAMVVFAVLVIAAVLFYTVGTQTSSESGAATPAPERLESSPTSPEGEALPPNRRGD